MMAFAAHADIISCAQSASDSTLACRSSSFDAKAREAAISAEYNQKVNGKSVKETAELMDEATRKIAAAYAAAEQHCHTHISSCQRECSDEDSQELSAACGEEMGKYTSVMNNGQSSNEAANKDAKKSETASSTAREREAFATREDRSKDVASKSPRADTAESRTVNRLNGLSAAARDNAPGVGSSSAFKTASLDPSRFMTALNGDLPSPALLNQIKQFCSDEKNSACPSCGDVSSLSKASPTQIKNACTQTCMADPAYGPQLADACRDVVRSGMSARGGDLDGTGGAGGVVSASVDAREATSGSMRTLASERAKLGYEQIRRAADEVGHEFGPELFAIHSRVITLKCNVWHLGLCLVHPN